MAGSDYARFTGKVQSYKRFRPTYPREIVDFLKSECGLTTRSLVVDIAAGTGLFAQLFLENGNTVLAIEPNEEMRAACSERQAAYPGLSILNGAAESTGLPAGCADFLTVAQAIHWFDLEGARQEFSRVLRPGGWCVVAYNNRRRGGDPFHDGYEKLLMTFGIDYQQVRWRHLGESELRAFFAPFAMRRQSFSNVQALDLDALIGRVLSSSYTPGPENPRFPALRQAIERLFTQYQKNGHVRLEYECVVRCGQLSP